MNKVIVIGLDGGTFDLIRPWAESGELPTFKKLLDEGSHGILLSTIPSNTSPAWPSFYTGTNPGKHGAWGFVRKDNSLVCAKTIDAKKIWDIVGEQGLKSVVLNVPTTYPPYKINGIMITGMLTPKGAHFAYPQEIEQELGDYFPEPQDLDLMMKNHARATKHLIKKPWDFFMVVFTVTDRVQHYFWDNKKKILKYYKEIDSEIKEILETQKDSTVFICSDHGFGPALRGFHVNTWLLKEGYLKLTKGEDTRVNRKILRGAKKKPVQLLSKIGITRQNMIYVLSKLHLEFIKQLVPRKLKQRLPQSGNVIDQTKSGAYSLSGEIYLNNKELKQEIIAKLNELKDPIDETKMVNKVYCATELYHGRNIGILPDIIFEQNPIYDKGDSFYSSDFTVHARRREGNHRREGVLIAYGPRIKKGVVMQDKNITDVAPTILHIMNLPIPANMDGKVMTEIFEPEFAKKEIQYIREAKEKGKISQDIHEIKI